MFHPGVHDSSWAPLTAQTQVRVGFRGRAAHPTGDPACGVDALAALIQLFNTMSVISRRLPSGSHVQGIVTDGGSATNVVPACAVGLFGLRAATAAALDVSGRRHRRLAQGVAAATGTTVEVARLGRGYAHFQDNDVLSDRFGEHIAHSGIYLSQPVGGVFSGSSDIGDVSSRGPHARVRTGCRSGPGARDDAGGREGAGLHGSRRTHRGRFVRSGVGPTAREGGGGSLRPRRPRRGRMPSSGCVLR
ncbi:peptidase dimerization domain-containing protein [Streptomyces nojiriensis]|uniref:peptidase dimerization domain-containing protein n=1 Tax=Streptomyces nojiriensis TaxID=66374 RepID=UPI002E173A47